MTERKPPRGMADRAEEQKAREEAGEEIASFITAKRDLSLNDPTWQETGIPAFGLNEYRGTHEIWHTSFGFKLEWIYDLSLLDKDRVTIGTDLIEKQARFIQALSGYDINRSFELRYLINPEENGNESTIELAFIGQTFGSDADSSQDAALSTYSELSNNFELDSDIYRFRPVVNEEELGNIIEPFNIASIGYICRRPIPLKNCSKPTIPIYQPDRRPVPSLARLCHALQIHPKPYFLSLVIRPTRLKDPEVSFLNSFQTLEEWEASTQYSRSVNNTHVRKAGFLAEDMPGKHILAQSSLKGVPCYFIMITIAGPSEFSPLLIETISSELYRDQPKARFGYKANGISNAGEIPSIENGSWVFAEQSEIKKKAIEHIRYHDCLPWGGQSISPDLWRLPYLMDATDASDLFRLPLPLDGKMPGLSIKRIRTSRQAGPISQTGVSIGRIWTGKKKTRVRIAENDNRRHIVVFGQTGVGKTWELAGMSLQQIQQGKGVGVLDPHGHLVDIILPRIPPERSRDVILFDAQDQEFPMGLNMIENDQDLPSLMDINIQCMIEIFYMLVSDKAMIGPMFEHWARMALLTLLLDPDEPATLVEFPRIFTDEKYRAYKVSKVEDPIIRLFWEKEIDKTSSFHFSEMLGYVVSKVGRFVESRAMRNIIGQKKSAFNIREAMDQEKICLINLSKGQIGPGNCKLLGLIFVFKFLQAALGRSNVEETERPDFYFYIDEAHNFCTESLSIILSEARKYRLNLCLATQSILQFTQQTRDAILGNIANLIAFRLGPQDADILKKQFNRAFSERELMYLPNFHAAARILTGGIVQHPMIIETEPIDMKCNELNAKRIVQRTRNKFGVKREEIEKEIFDRLSNRYDTK